MRKTLALVVSVAVATAAGCSPGNSSGSSNGTSMNSIGAINSAAEQKVSFTARNPFVANVNRKGQIILVGVTNDEKGSFAYPGMRAAIEAAIKQINASGGINGAQTKEDVCLTDGTPDSAINCANKLVGDHVALITTGLGIANQAALPIIAGAKIPWISNQTYIQTNSDYVWQMGVPISAFSLYSILAFKQLGSKRPSYLGTDDSTHQAQAKQFVKWGRMADVKPIVGPLQSPTNPDWSTAVQTIQTQGGDAIKIGVTEEACTAFMTAATQLGFKAPVMTTCLDYLNTLPHSATANTYYGSSAYSPTSVSQAPAQIQANMADYVKWMNATGATKYIPGSSEYSYGTTQNIATVLRTISAPQLTSASIQEALGKDRNLPGFDGPDFNCGSHVWAAAPNACSAYILVTKNTFVNNKLVQVPIKQSNFGWFADASLAAKSTEVG